MKTTRLVVGLAGALILSAAGTPAKAERAQPFCQGHGLPTRCSVPLGVHLYFWCSQCDKGRGRVLEIVGGDCPKNIHRTCGCVDRSSVPPGVRIRTAG